MKYNIPAVIFAGGKSSRMGEDKALLPFQDFDTLTEFQHHKLSQIFTHVYISSKTDKFGFPVHIVEDISTISSPLVGIISALEQIKSDRIFILCVDAPFVDRTIIDTIIKDDQKHHYRQATIAKTPQGTQALCGIYHKSMLSLAKEQLAQNNHKLQTLLAKAETSYVNFEDEKKFLNLNDKEAYLEALGLSSPLFR